MKHTYRPEVDGLRAIAVLPVMLFHAEIPGFSGGYVGVDVFFVISGYLITGIILSELSTGTFTIAGFYERRARRILPALTFVVLACLPAAWLLLPPGDFVDFAKSESWVALFSSNVYFRHNGSYFDAATTVRPLLHTWSLGVEEQFYLFFPLFLVAMRRLGSRMLLPAVAMVLAASLALAQWAALYRPEAAFYLLPTRGWELMIGALISIHAVRRGAVAEADVPAPRRAVWLSALGLALILVSVVTFDDQTLIPGIPALLPTVGAALIIAYASPSNIMGRVLGARPLVVVGLISYSAYLWHQPLLAFTRWASLTPPSDAALMAAAGLALPMAYISWRFVERPFRDRRRMTRRQIGTFAVATTAVMFTAGAIVTRNNGFASRFAIAPATLASLQRPSMMPGCMDAEDMDVRSDWVCRIGRTDTVPSFLLVGDSHTMVLEPAFDSAGRALGVAGEVTAMSACPPIAHVYRQGRPGAVQVCHDWNDRVLNFVAEHKTPLVVLVGRWAAYTDGGYAGRQLRPLSAVPGRTPTRAEAREAFEAGFRSTVAQLVASGARVVVVDQVPEQMVDAPFKVYARLAALPADAKPDALRAYSVGRADYSRLHAFSGDFLQALESAPSVRVLRLDDQFCDGDRCLIGAPGVSWYRDNHHLSAPGAMRVVDRVAAMLRIAVPSGPQ